MAANTGFEQQCPSCDHPVPIKDPGLVGRKIDCPKCKYRFVVEEPGNGEATTAEKPRKKKAATNQAVTAKKPVNGKVKGKPVGKKRRDEDDEDLEEKPRKGGKDSSKKNLMIGLGIAGAAVVLLGIAGFFMFGGTKEPPAPPPSGPGTAAVVQPPAPKAEDKPVAAVLDLPYALPSDTEMVLNVPLQTLKDKTLLNALPVDQVQGLGAIEEKIGFGVPDVERLLAAVSFKQDWLFVVVRTSKEIKSDSLMQTLDLIKAADSPIEGQDYMVTKDSKWADFGGALKAANKGGKDPGPLAVRFHDPKTLVLGNLIPMRQFLKSRGRFAATESKDQPPGGAPGGAPPGATQGPGGAPGGPPGGGPPGGMTGGPGARTAGPLGGGAPGMGPGMGPGMAPGMGPGMAPGMMPPGSSGTEVPPSTNYMTIHKDLKAMLDRIEAKPPTLISLAIDVKAAMAAAMPIGPAPLAGLGGKAVPLPVMLGFGLQQTNEKMGFHLALEFAKGEDAQLLNTTLQDGLKNLTPLAKLFLPGFRIESAQPAGVGGMPGMMPGAPGGMPGAPGGMPGAPGAVPGAPGAMPGGAGAGPIPGAPGGAGAAPGMLPGGPPPGQPNQQEKPDPNAPSITYSLAQSSKMVTFSLELNNKATEVLLAMVEPMLHEYKGDVEMSMSRSRPEDLARAQLAYLNDPKNQKQFERGTYPPAFDPSRYRPLPPDERVSWMAGLLPYLNHGDTFAQIKTDRSWRDPVNSKAARTLIPQFLDSKSPRDRWRVSYPGLENDGSLGATHFIGIAGIGLDAATYDPAGDPALAKKVGVFGYDRMARLSEIVDGLANTAMIIEVPWDKVQFPWTTHPRPWIAGGGATIQGVPETNSIQPFVSTSNNGKRGTVVMMADGSVRFVSDKVSDKVFQAMCTINGGEKVDVNKDAPVLTAADQVQMKTEPNLRGPDAKKEEPKATAPGGLGAIREAAQRQIATNDLKQIGLYYHNYYDTFNKAPAGLEELKKLKIDMESPTVYQALKEGRYVVNWNLNIRNLTAGTSNTVLGYEKDAPANGGLVLMADGSVKTMTAAEFQAASKAK